MAETIRLRYAKWSAFGSLALGAVGQIAYHLMQSAGVRNAPWPVTYGPSTRRLIDFADPAHGLTINPVGQSGVPFDKHYRDQAESYIEGDYDKPHMDEAEIQLNTRSTLRLMPVR